MGMGMGWRHYDDTGGNLHIMTMARAGDPV